MPMVHYGALTGSWSVHYVLLAKECSMYRYLVGLIGVIAVLVQWYRSVCSSSGLRSVLSSLYLLGMCSTISTMGLY